MKIAIKKPIHEYYTLKELLSKWDITQNDLFEHCKNGNLKILLNWKQLREREHNTICIHDKDYLEPVITANTCGGFEFRSPCWTCPEFKNTSVCKFDFPHMFNIDNLSGSEQKDQYRVSAYSDDLLFVKEDVERFQKEFQEESNQSKDEHKPEYLQPSHPYYSRELEAMIRAWHSIFMEKKDLDQRSCKQSVMNFIEQNYEDAAWKYDKIDKMGSIVAYSFQETKENTWSKFLQGCKIE
jgi:hypothetical protein